MLEHKKSEQIISVLFFLNKNILILYNDCHLCTVKGQTKYNINIVSMKFSIPHSVNHSRMQPFSTALKQWPTQAIFTS